MAECLLDYLARELDLAYVSDLHKNTYRESMKYMIENLYCRQFLAFDRNDAVFYLVNEATCFTDCRSTQLYLLRKLREAGLFRK